MALELTTGVGDPAYASREFQDFVLDVEHLRDYLVGDAKGGPLSGVTAASPIAKVVAAAATTTALNGKVDGLAAALTALTAKVDALAAAPANINIQALAQATATDVAASLPQGYQPVAEGMLVDALITALKTAFDAIPAPAAVKARPVSLADVDARTQAAREARQSGIAGSAE